MIFRSIMMEVMSYIDDAGTGNLRVRSGTLNITNLAGSKTSANFNSATGQELYYNNTKRFETTNTNNYWVVLVD